MSRALIAEWRYQALLVSVVLAAGGYLAGTLWSGWEEVTTAAHRVGFIGIATALALSLFNYLLRFVRWTLYLEAMGHRLPRIEHLRIYLAGFALTTTPGKAGEALRSVLLKRWRVGYAQSLAALFSERLSDLVAILLLVLAGLFTYPGGGIVAAVAAVLVLAALIMLSQKKVIEGLRARTQGTEGKIGRGVYHVVHLLREARRCHGPQLIVLATLLSILAWSAEALAFHWILVRLGTDTPFGFSVFVYASSMLAGAISLLPGGLGGTEAVMISMLLWRGVSMPDAVTATVLIRMATLWFAVVLGLLALLGDRMEKEE